jgi:glycosyltransferase involved in cell wall biosynthesis
MAKIALDTTPTLDANKYRGVGRYTSNLVEALKRYNKLNEYILYSRGQKLPNVDLIHYPYFDLFFLTLPIFRRVKTVVTVHDVIPLIFPNNFSVGMKGKLKLIIQRMALKSVNAIITDSRQSKEDISRYLRIPEEKIFIVHLAADPVFKPIPKFEAEKLTEKYHLPSKFVLYVGDINYNKNVPRLLEAVKKVGCNLVLVGKAFMNEDILQTKEILNLISKLNLEKKVWRLGYIENRELCGLYNAADICTQPSLYEGFGLAIIEAMACGAVVACSDIPVHREITGDIASYFDSKDENKIAEVLSSLLETDDNELKLRRRESIKQSEKFSWRKTAQDTVKVYDKILFS